MGLPMRARKHMERASTYDLQKKKKHLTRLICAKSRLAPFFKTQKIGYAQKHPIVRNEHLKNYYAGIQSMLNFNRHKYSIIDGKNAVRHIICNLIFCSKVNPTLLQYILGNLPANRVKEACLFENSGIDYCGPFYIKEMQYRNRGKTKIYVVAFVCFATKAVHL